MFSKLSEKSFSFSRNYITGIQFDDCNDLFEAIWNKDIPKIKVYRHIILEFNKYKE